MKPKPFNSNGAFRLATDAEAKRSRLSGGQRGAFVRAATSNGNRADALLKKFD